MRIHRAAWVAAALLLGAAGCADEDAGGAGADVAGDAGPTADVAGDTGATDTGATDSGATDTGATDSGATDTGTTDSGSTDTGTTDTGATDVGTDTGTADTGTTDVGTDAGADVADDTGTTDAADDTGTDTGTPDADAGAPQCASACDCEQGWSCAGGQCVLGIDPVFCCTNDGCPSGSACVGADGTAGLCGVETSPLFGQVLFNEVLIDGASDGDPNGDGEPGDPVGDELVEIVNAGGAVDLGGFTLVETDFPGLPRHTFTAGTTLAAGAAIVIFGGGEAPSDIPGAHFEVANAPDPGIPFGLNLDNDGDTLRLLDKSGKLVALFGYGGAAPLAALSDESYTRSPDVTGPFVPHSQASGDPSIIYSPGTQADGSPFGGGAP